LGILAGDVAFPNGMAITPDGGTLIVAESYANRLTAYDIGADGGLGNRRVWAETPGDHPDGICIDAEDAVWYLTWLTIMSSWRAWRCDLRVLGLR
jgi:sugar lactone lactonase YvrE